MCSVITTGTVAQEFKPVLEATIRDMDGLKSSAISVGKHFQDASMISKAMDEMMAEIGNGMDKTKPVSIAIWIDGAVPLPTISARIPVKDYNEFENSFKANVSGGEENFSIRESNGYAIVNQKMGPVSKRVQKLEAQWSPKMISAISGDQMVANVSLNLNPQVKALANASLTQAKASMEEVFKNIPQPDSDAENPLMPFDMSKMGELMGLYFDTISAFVNQTDSLQYSIGANDDEILLGYEWDPTDGSEAEKFCKVTPGGLGDLSKFIQADKSSYFLANINIPKSVMTPLTKFMNISMEMQGIKMSESELKEMSNFMNSFMKYKAAGYMDLQNGIKFSAVYDFGQDATINLDNFIDYYQGPGVSGMVGKDKLFDDLKISNSTITNAGDKLDVTKVSMSLNTDLPYLNVSGQGNVLEALYGGKEMKYEMAANKSYMFYAMNSSIKDIMRKGTGITTPIQENTILWAKMDIWGLVSGVMKAQPGMEEVFKNLGNEPAVMEIHSTGGTKARFDIKMDHGLLKNIASLIKNTL